MDTEGGAVADLRLDQTDELAAEPRHDFYADAEMMKQAFQRGRAFNLIHLGSVHKIDIFPLGYSREAFNRRRFARAESLGGRSSAFSPVWKISC